MNTALQNSTSNTDNRPSDERTQSPPAFLDLADSVRSYHTLVLRGTFQLTMPVYVGREVRN
jgi:hypothetical protein